MNEEKIFQHTNHDHRAGYYYSGQFRSEPPSGPKLSTWRTIGNTRREDVKDLAWVIAGGRSFEDVIANECDSCAPALERLKAYIKASKISKVDMVSNPVSSFIPTPVLSDFYEAKNQVTGYIIENYKKAENYNFLKKLSLLMDSISSQVVRVDGNDAKGVRYNIFGTKTGRLTVERGSFPILTIPKASRSSIVPNNDYFLEVDYNGAELRTLLGLSNLEQPKGDVHLWNVRNFGTKHTTRQEMKVRFFAWMYNPGAYDADLQKHYNKEVYRDYWNGTQVLTPFGRTLDVDSSKALNYLIQSSTSDLVLGKALELDSFLSDKTSNIAFIMHDSIIIDLKKEDLNSVGDIKRIMKSTQFGEYMLNVSIKRDLLNPIREVVAV